MLKFTLFFNVLKTASSRIMSTLDQEPVLTGSNQPTTSLPVPTNQPTTSLPVPTNHFVLPNIPIYWHVQKSIFRFLSQNSQHSEGATFRRFPTTEPSRLGSDVHMPMSEFCFPILSACRLLRLVRPRF